MVDSLPVRTRAATFWVLLAAAAALPGCTIIINPSVGDVPTPIPVPLTCAPGNSAPTAHIIFSTRIEKTTVNLAGHYSRFITNTGLMLAGAGLQPTNAVLLRADERPRQNEVLAAWGCTLDSPEELSPKDVITYYAINEPLEEAPLGCVTDTLTSAGEALPDLVTRYPPQLSGTNNARVFSTAPDLVLVVHLDGLPRRTGLADTQCASAEVMAQTLGDDTAAWLSYVDRRVPLSRVVHWFVATEEGMDRSTFVERCRRFEAFPTDVLDVLEPSAQALYTPLAERIQQGGGVATFFPMCEMLGADARFFKEQAALIGGLVGLDVDPDKVIEVIENGGVLPGPEGEGALGPRPG